MSEEVRDEWGGFETVAIAAKGSWFDLIERVVYENRAPFAIRIGLGHTPRKVVHIVIDVATKEDQQKLKAKAIEGEVIE
jgi:hypothetical protein